MHTPVTERRSARHCGGNELPPFRHAHGWRAPILWRRRPFPPLAGARNSGFTLIELLVVITIISILVVASIGIYNQAQIAAWKQKSRDTARQLAVAWNARLMEEHTFPVAALTATSVAKYTDPNSLTFETTTNNMVPLTSSGSLDQNAEQRQKGMRDKWGRTFLVRLDTDYDGIVTHPVDLTSVHANVIAWSLGPNPSNPSNSWVVVWPQ
jgi:prepilin-type N-terminal cleavage/methylation domain-containing protein